MNEEFYFYRTSKLVYIFVGDYETAEDLNLAVEDARNAWGLQVGVFQSRPEIFFPDSEDGFNSVSRDQGISWFGEE